MVKRLAFLLVLASALAGIVAPAAQAVSGTWRTAVIVIRFPDAPDDQTSGPWSKSMVESQVFGDESTDPYSVRQYYKEQTYGQLDITGDVYGPYEVANPGGDTNCGFQYWGIDAADQAKADGFDYANYQGIVYVFATNRCSFAGLGGGSESYINGLNRYTIAHELGHGFGNAHAHTLRCWDGGTEVPLSDTCDMDEYGDPFDPMGSGGTILASLHEAVPHQMQPTRKLVIGSLAESDAPMTNTPGNYRIAPLERDTGTRALRLPAGRETGQYFSLSFRQPLGRFDSTWLDPDAGNPQAFDGVLVTLDMLKGGDTSLLDMTPETGAGGTHPWTHMPLTGFEDARLPVGRTYHDAHTGLSLTVNAVSPEGADVTLDYGRGAVDVASPTIPGTPSATVADGVVTLSWGESRDAAGVEKYVVSRNGTDLPSVGSTGLTDRPGTGTFEYRVRAVDPSGHASPASETARAEILAGPSGGPGGGATPEALTLTDLRLTPSSFRSRAGTKMTFRLNRAAGVSFSFTRLVAGRRSGRRCVAPGKAPRGKPCTRKVAVSKRLTVAGKQGANSVAFTGRLDRRTRLGVGRYRLAAVASDAAGVSSGPARASFRMLRAARKRKRTR